MQNTQTNNQQELSLWHVPAKQILKMPEHKKFLTKLVNNILGSKKEVIKMLERLKQDRTRNPDQHFDITVKLDSEYGSLRLFYIYFDKGKFEIYLSTDMITGYSSNKPVFLSAHRNPETTYKTLEEYTIKYIKKKYSFVYSIWF